MRNILIGIALMPVVIASGSRLHGWSAPSPQSALAIAAAALGDGDWGSFTAGNQLDTDALTGFSILPYSHKSEVDEAHGLLQLFGGGHGDTPDENLQVATFNFATNLWTNPPDPHPQIATLVHGYAQGTVDQATGDVLYFGYGEDIPELRDYTTGIWTPFSQIQNAYNITRGLQYHPGLYSGAGGFVAGDGAGIRVAPRTGPWSWALDRRNELDAMGAYSQDATWNPNDGCVYVGGGEGASGVKLYKVDASGTATQIANAPVPVYHGAGGATLLLGCGKSSSKLKLIDLGTANIYEYTPGTDSWSGVIGTLPSALTDALDADDLVSFAASRAHECVIAITCPSQANGLTSATIQLWKV